MGFNETWLTEERLRIYPRIFLLVYAGALAYWTLTTFVLAPEAVTSLRNDFAAFWTTGHLVLEGRASDAYEPAHAFAAQATHMPEQDMTVYWFYPPQNFFLIAGFALLPFLPAFFLWVAAGVTCLALTVRALAPHSATVWLLLASPGLFWALRWGQTGFFAAALLGGAFYCLFHGRPFWAGILIGLLTFKPHFGLLLPFALVAARKWRTFGAATVTALLLAGACAAAFGPDIWLRFLAAMDNALVVQYDGTLPPHQMVSLYAALITLGLPLDLALGAEFVLAGLVLIVVVFVWWRQGASPPAAALLAAGTVLTSAHVHGYDLVLYAPAIAILAWDGVKRGWLWGERTSYIFLWVWPWLAEVVQQLTGFAPGVLGSLLLFALALRRCRVMGSDAAAGGPHADRL